MSPSTAEITSDMTLPRSRIGLQKIRKLIEKDLLEVDQLAREHMASDVELANRIASHIVEAGGKRLRAALVVLCGYALGGLRDRKATLLLASVVEFIHTATLLHDDVVDESVMRRGRDTAHVLWGNDASVLTGDFFFARAFGMIAEINRARLTQILADASKAIAEGELMELMHARQIALSEEDYLIIIEGKTAKLFEASCKAAACIEEAESAHIEALADYGRLLGAAFQIADDAIDYLEHNGEADKSIGDDLAGGRMTLPYIYALRQAESADREFLEHVIQDGQREQISEVNAIMHRCGAIDYSLERAQGFAQRARQNLDVIGDTRWRDALNEVANFSVLRKF